MSDLPYLLKARGKSLKALAEIVGVEKYVNETDQSLRDRALHAHLNDWSVPMPDPVIRKPWRYWLLWLTSLPWDVVVIVAVLLIRVLWGKKLEWNEGLWCELKPDSWPTRTWYRYKGKKGYQKVPPELREQYGTWQTWGGTCLGHGGFFGPGKMGAKGIDVPVEFHEHVHVEQAEVSMLTSFLVALSAFLVLWLTSVPLLAVCAGVWFLGYSLKALSGWLVAWFRGEDPYWGSTHEEAAYALTENYLREKGDL